MECPHCGFSQPEGVECVQCHTPLGELADLLRDLEFELPVRERPNGDMPDGEGQGGQSPPVSPSAKAARPAVSEQVQRVRLTTAPHFSGMTIRAYRGLVSAQVLVQMEPGLDVVLQSSPVLSLRTTGMGAHLNQALAVGIGDLRLAAVKGGGNAIISVTMAYQPMMGASAMLLTLSGTAVEVVRERRGG